MEEPSEGSYELLGQDIKSLSENKRNEINRSTLGFVFQAYHLIDELTVYENIETPLLYRNMASAERKSRVADILDRFQMVAKKDLFPSQLSGGQQQLVGIARALVTEPKIILADEPTGNLHSDQAKYIMEIFSELNKKDGVTIIQVTHSDINATYGNRIVKLKDGWIE
jgi:putative ABC transport system ATP-binding protein